MFCGTHVGAVGDPVNTIDGSRSVLGGAQARPFPASVANMFAASQEAFLPTNSWRLSQLAPEGCPHAHGLHAKLPVYDVYQSLRCKPAGHDTLPEVIAQRVGLLVAAGRQTEPAPQPPPFRSVAQKRPVIAQVGVPAVGVPVALHPGYIGVNGPTLTP